MTGTVKAAPKALSNSLRGGPDEHGHFGIYGGRYVAETLMPLVLQVEKAWEKARHDPAFWEEFNNLSRDYIGRPSPLYFAEATTRHFGGARIWFKRDELNHTGAHKINNCLGQVLLARRMGKSRVIAETGAGQLGWRPRPYVLCLIYPARFLWGRPMSNGKNLMSSG